MTLQSWINPKAQKGLPSKIHGKGLIATEHIGKGEIVAVKAGQIINKQKLRDFGDVINDSQLQISDDLFLAPLTPEEFEGSMVYINHSCEPNAGLGGNIIWVALRDIQAGEEVAFDYAMQWSDNGFKFECNCRSANCRKLVTGDDWKNPELQKKYAGYFSWYLEQKIKNQSF